MCNICGGGGTAHLLIFLGCSKWVNDSALICNRLKLYLAHFDSCNSCSCMYPCTLQVYDKAVDEPSYSSMYAQLCLRLSKYAPNFEDSGSKANVRVFVSVCTWWLFCLCTCNSQTSPISNMLSSSFEHVNIYVHVYSLKWTYIALQLENKHHVLAPDEEIETVCLTGYLVLGNRHGLLHVYVYIPNFQLHTHVRLHVHVFCPPLCCIAGVYILFRHSGNYCFTSVKKNLTIENKPTKVLMTL